MRLHLRIGLILALMAKTGKTWGEIQDVLKAIDDLVELGERAA